MAVSKQEAIAELQRRGVQIPGVVPQPTQQPPAVIPQQISAAQAESELQRRGIGKAKQIMSEAPEQMAKTLGIDLEQKPSAENLKHLFWTGAAAGRGLGQDLVEPFNFAMGTNYKLAPSGASRKEKMLGRIIGAMPLYEAGGALAEGLPLISRLPGIAQRAGVAAGVGAATDPKHPVMAGLMGAALSPVADLAQKAVETGINPSQVVNAILRPKAAPEQIEALQSVLPKGIKMPAGDLAQSTPLKKVQMVLQNIPLTGAEKGHEQLNKFVKNYGEDFYNNLKGSDIDNLNDEVFNKISDNYEKNLNEYKSKRNEFLIKSDKAKIEPKLNNFKSALIENTLPIIDKLSPLREAEGLKPDQILKTGSLLNTLEPEDKAIAHLYNKYTTKLPASFAGKGNSMQSLYEDLNKQGNILAKGKNWNAYHAVKNMRENLLRDMESSMPESSSLAKDFRGLNTFYKNKVVPFRSTRIAGRDQATPFFKTYTTEDKDTGRFIDKYLKTGAQKDQYAQLHRLLNLLPEKDDKELITAYHLRPALAKVRDETKVSPSKLLSQYGKLGTTQKDILFGDKSDDFEKLKTLKNSFPDVFNLDYSPKTGHLSAKVAGLMGELIPGLTLAGMGHVVPGMAVAAAPILGGRLAARTLGSETLINLLKKQAKPAEKKALLRLLPLLRSGSLSAAQQLPQTGGQQ